jgi:lantibiotic modifying enzyme
LRATSVYSKLIKAYLLCWRSLPPEHDTALGICNGSGSLICVLLSHLTGDERWLDFGKQIAQSMTKSAIHECQEPDITSGISGLLVAFVALYEACKERPWLDAA